MENGCAAQAFPNVQVVIKGVGSPEVLADAEYVERGICAVQSGRARRYSRKYLLAGLPSKAVVKSIQRNGRRAYRVVLKPISPARRAIVQKRGHIALTIETPTTPAHPPTALPSGL